MPQSNRFRFNYWIELWEIDINGNRLIPSTDDISGWFIDHEKITVTIDKSITSNSDSATVEVVNHIAIERIYKEKGAFFSNLFEKDYEVDIMMFHECESLSPPNDQSVICIFSGDLDDLYIKEDSSVTDQSLMLKLTAGKNAATRSIVNKKYAAGTTYKAMVEDLFTHFKGYRLAVLDDPMGRLNKTLPKTRTVHKKAADVLNDIARDLEMTWGFDANPWKLSERRPSGSDGTTGFNLKHCYFVDKSSVFDVLEVNGAGNHEMNGSTGKKGRIGYAKSQFTFEHLFDNKINIGVAVAVSDFGTMNDAVEFVGRINRMSVSDQNVHIEAEYIDEETGRAIVNYDKKHTGALVL